MLLTPIARKIMTKPLVTLGIAGGTGAGKVGCFFVFWIKLLFLFFVLGAW
jgi:hypothetical protein